MRDGACHRHDDLRDQQYSTTLALRDCQLRINEARNPQAQIGVMVANSRPLMIRQTGPRPASAYPPKMPKMGTLIAHPIFSVRVVSESTAAKSYACCERSRRQ
jgi:hypothetical protein